MINPIPAGHHVTAIAIYDRGRENAALFAAFQWMFDSSEGVTFDEFLDLGFDEIEAKIVARAGEYGQPAGLEVNRSSRREERVLISYTSGRRFVAVRVLDRYWHRWECRIDFPGGSRVAAGAILDRLAGLRASHEIDSAAHAEFAPIDSERFRSVRDALAPLMHDSLPGLPAWSRWDNASDLALRAGEWSETALDVAAIVEWERWGIDPPEADALAAAGLTPEQASEDVPGSPCMLFEALRRGEITIDGARELAGVGGGL